MNRGDELSPILDLDELVPLTQRVRRVLRRQSDGGFDLTPVADWTAMPVESSSHLNESDSARIAEAFLAQGHEQVFALEELKGIVPAYKVTVSQTGLTSFNRACAHFNYALCPEDMSSLAICTTDDYFVVAAPPDIVRVMLENITLKLGPRLCSADASHRYRQACKYSTRWHAPAGLIRSRGQIDCDDDVAIRVSAT